jgi:hypothetical protein
MKGISSLRVFGKTKGYLIIKLSTQKKNLNPRFFDSENFQKIKSRGYLICKY